MLSKLTPFYFDKKTLFELNRQNKISSYKRIGIILDYKISLSDILYRHSIIKRGKNNINIDENTYLKSNEFLLKSLIDYLDIRVQLGRRNRTLENDIFSIKYLIKFINETTTSFVISRENLKKVYISYSLKLKQEIRMGILSSNTAQKHQYKALGFFELMVDDRENYIGSNINLIKTTRSSSLNKNENQENVSYSFDFYLNLFIQITEFLLKFHKFPYKISSLHYEAYLMPYGYRQTSFIRKDQENIFFNYDKGIFRNKNEFKTHSNQRIRERLQYHKNKLDYNNDANNTKNRMELGTIALMAYYMHFLAVTGMNDSTAATIVWSDEFRLVKDSQVFKNIKFRANSKIVASKIEKRYIKYFKKFIQLRDFLLGKFQNNYLFFTGYGENANLGNNQLKGSFSSSINRRILLFVNPDLPTVNSREWRQYKIKHNIKKHGEIVASRHAQNSVEVTLTNYTGENKESTESQITDYFESLNKLIVNTSLNTTDTSIGKCNELNHPKTTVTLNHIISNCKQQEGCLFCEEYRIHTEKEDIRKLFSLLYIINETRFITTSQEHFDGIYSIVIKRIHNILDYISSIVGENTINQVKKDVMENQNLHPYWNAKLIMLINAGILK